MDNGPKIVSVALADWAEKRGVDIARRERVRMKPSAVHENGLAIMYKTLKI